MKASTNLLQSSYKKDFLES